MSADPTPATGDETPAAGGTPAPPEDGLKEGFLRFTERFGHMMSRILLTVLYVVLVAPAGLVISLFGDGLRIRKYRGTAWNDWPQPEDTLERARRQD